MRSNKTCRTALEREEIGRFVKAYMTTGRFSKDFDSLECKERLDMELKMLPYVIPKLRCVDPEAVESEAEPSIDEILKRVLTS